MDVSSDEPADGPIPGVGAVILERGALLLVQRGRGPGQGLWAVPGGKVRFGETLRQAVIREVMEETGLEIEPGEVVWVGDSLGPGDPPAWHYTLVDFAARVVGGDATAGDDALGSRVGPAGGSARPPAHPDDGRSGGAAQEGRRTADGSHKRRRQRTVDGGRWTADQAARRKADRWRIPLDRPFGR